MPAASISSTLTQLVGDYGIYAVFLLMLIDAVFPAGSEIVMVYGGAIASGAIAGAVGDAVRLHVRARPLGLPRDRGRRHGRLPDRLRDRLGDRHPRRPALSGAARALASPRQGEARPRRGVVRTWGDWAVLLGRLTPVVRSFISIPAGVFEAPFRRYTVLTLIGSAIWCFVVRRHRLGGGRELGELPPRLPVRGHRHRRRDRRRRRLARLAIRAQAACAPVTSLTCGSLVARDRRFSLHPGDEARARPGTLGSS